MRIRGVLALFLLFASSAAVFADDIAQIFVFVPGQAGTDISDSDLAVLGQLEGKVRKAKLTAVQVYDEELGEMVYGSVYGREFGNLQFMPDDSGMEVDWIDPETPDAARRESLVLKERFEKTDYSSGRPDDPDDLLAWIENLYRSGGGFEGYVVKAVPTYLGSDYYYFNFYKLTTHYALSTIIDMEYSK